MNVRELEPKALWNYFSDLNAVPRASKKEERVIEFIKNFGESLNLPTLVDETGNVIIRKPASKGMEHKTPIVLQSHLDMVHQKNADTDFDFGTQGIDMYVDDDWVKARGTTLGADNGIGVASIMSILASADIEHPAIDALFTIDEETGMTGAIGLKGGLLNGRILLNLDTEDDRELTIGCAGGVDVTGNGEYESMPVPGNLVCYKASVKGLTGGHSGMDIHLGRGNANKLIVRFLMACRSFGLRMCCMDGGGLRNAIPREAECTFFIQAADDAAFKTWADQYASLLQSEYRTTDPNISFSIQSVEGERAVISENFQNQLLTILHLCPNGIFRMSPEISGLVQTSNNLARVLVGDGRYSIQCLTRSSVDSEKDYLAGIIQAGFQLLGADATLTGSYPGWTPNPDAAILKIMENLYRSQFNHEPDVNACHAGLECGILGRNYPGMEMISFGTDIRGAHSPDEKVQISSVQKFWGFLLDTLKEIPEQIAE